ncbi:hypothetical protein GGI07_004534 [Coemansia sp. Benny D115]|nr:hypothetical protein GGI07_004534 [Coemansia sp. Benny D115]
MHRKKPFSVKQKKAQMQAKRAKKRNEVDSDDYHSGDEQTQTTRTTPRPQPQLIAGTGDRRNKLTSQFDKLSREEIEHNKRRSMRPIQRLSPEEGLTMSFDDAYSADVDIPVRPAWSYGQSKASLEAREVAFFNEWLENIQALKDEDSVSLYEKNLEVWRQLWRVVEISDILLMVVDIRHPVLHFPPSLYRYITKTTGKPLVVVLNKTDLVTANTVAAWKKYFKDQFPSVILTTFCCYKDKILKSETVSGDAARLAKKAKVKRVYDSSQVGELFAACRTVCEPQKQSLVDWDALIARYTDKSKASTRSSNANDANSDGEEDDDDDVEEVVSEDEDGDSSKKPTSTESKSDAKTDTDADTEARPAEGHVESVSSKYVTLGLVGHPNVGKSTVINSIMGRTVVSTSRTPGHTKHFQTIHVTPTLRLCDCPGLVFPCVVERPLQVLAGLYNTAQVQEPYTSVMYLAERLPLETMLNLLPSNTSAMVKGQWSAWGICEAFAVDRGFFTSKAARPDVYRAALYLLRWELDGRVLLSFKPPGFFRDAAYASDNAQGTTKSARRESEPEAGKSMDVDNDPSSDDGSDEEDNARPIAQQSAFALLGEEYC